jgi:protein phosphatase
MLIKIPDYCLVLLIGPTGSGKSSFAARHFAPTEVVSSDRCRGMVVDDEADQGATADAFALLHAIVEMRLKNRRLTVIDATNVRKEDRAKLVSVAKQHYTLVVGIAFEIDEAICIARNKLRPDRNFGAHVVRSHLASMRKGLRDIDRQGIRYLHRLTTPEAIDAVSIEREPLWVDRRGDHGPFDIIGDIHGCGDELEALLAKLGYGVTRSPADGTYQITPPDGRRAVFVGDLVDRGPRTPDVLRLVKAMVDGGTALCVVGNHEAKLVKWLGGKPVKPSHGLAQSIAQLEQETPEFREEMRSFLDGLVSHYVLDGGKLVVAHAGLPEAMHNRASGAVRGFALYGETSGEVDEFGLPVRYNWALDYKGRARVVYGHTPVPEADWLNGTLCIDTGCVFGGKLTALRYPEIEIVSVPAAQVYFEPVRPLGAKVSVAADTGVQIDLADVMGKRAVETGLMSRVTVREENAAAALEVMSRWAIDPRWLIHLPPTMSPPETAADGDLLEHPDQVFAHFRAQGVTRVIAQEKHMGSRALLVVCRDAAVAARRFQIEDGTRGAVYTRTGRAFFPRPDDEAAVLERLAQALESSGLWSDLATDWVLLDAEIMPWSTKAQALIEQQYAPVGVAADVALSAAGDALAQAMARGVDLGGLDVATADRLARVRAYRQSYNHYIWPVDSLTGLRIAPFHLLATESAVHGDKDHSWHMGVLAKLCAADPALLFQTAWKLADIDDAAATAAITDWWTLLTAQGGEGIVVKPVDFTVRGKRGLVQPALKCRGPEYLRIIYGPEYDRPENLARLRNRAVSAKRSRALREFALGLEALERFVRHEPLSRVHECVFAVLALESEPIDPRL